VKQIDVYSQVISNVGNYCTVQFKFVILSDTFQRIPVILFCCVSWIAICACGVLQNVDPLLDYLENNLKVLYKKLEATIYPLFSEEILKAEIIILLENLEVGVS